MAYIQGRLSGKSKKQAALDAGFSQTMAEHAADKIETKDVREAFARLVREMVPPELIAKTIADGMAASETKFFSHEGVVQDSRDVPAWSERRQYAELAAEYGGYHVSSKNDQGSSGAGVILILPGGQPQPVPDDRTVIDVVPKSETARNLLVGENDGQAQVAAIQRSQQLYKTPSSTWPIPSWSPCQSALSLLSSPRPSSAAKPLSNPPPLPQS